MVRTPSGEGKRVSALMECIAGRCIILGGSLRKAPAIHLAAAPHTDPGGTCRNANPSYTAEELAYQLDAVKARLLIVHPSILPAAVEAARTAGLPDDRIVLFDPVPGSPYPNLQDLVSFGASQPQKFTPFQLRPGEARTKIALLSFSSGTTGRPKVRVFELHTTLFPTLI